MHKDDFFPVFPHISYSDWYFRALFSLLTLMLFLRRICPPIFCFSSTLYTWVRCCNLSAQRKWWMGSWMAGVIHYVTNHGIFSLWILYLFKIHYPGCQQKSLSVSRTVISLHRNYVPCRLILFQSCNSPPLKNRLIYLALTRAWSDFHLILCPKFHFCHGEVCYSWFKWTYYLF